MGIKALATVYAYVAFGGNVGFLNTQWMISGVGFDYYDNT